MIKSPRLMAYKTESSTIAANKEEAPSAMCQVGAMMLVYARCLGSCGTESFGGSKTDRRANVRPCYRRSRYECWFHCDYSS